MYGTSLPLPLNFAMILNCSKKIKSIFFKYRRQILKFDSCFDLKFMQHDPSDVPTDRSLGLCSCYCGVWLLSLLAVTEYQSGTVLRA